MGTAFFGPAAVVSAGGSDVFISRITSAGAFFWTSQAGGSMDANCRGLAINTSNEVFVTGFFQGTASFGPSTFTSNNGSKDIFGALLGSSGQFLWAFKVGGPENDGAYEATVDAFNDFYFTGNFKNTAVFGPYILNSFGDDDVFVAKVNSSGFFIWAHNAGGTNEDKGYALSIDNTGSLFVTGSFEGTADFDSQTIISAGDRDVFMASYNSAGSLNLIERAGGPGFDRGYGIVKRYGLAYVTGVFEQTADFGSNIITSQGSSDLFVFKFDEPLSIAEASGSNINIYPSPFVHYCYIESSSIDLSEAELQLFDMTGRKVQISSEVSDGKIKIDSNGLGNGIYQLIIMVDDSVYSKKVCINKF